MKNVHLKCIYTCVHSPGQKCKANTQNSVLCKTNLKNIHFILGVASLVYRVPSLALHPSLVLLLKAG